MPLPVEYGSFHFYVQNLILEFRSIVLIFEIGNNFQKGIKLFKLPPPN